MRQRALLAVVLRAKHVFVIQCQCPWKERANWRGEFSAEKTPRICHWAKWLWKR